MLYKVYRDAGVPAGAVNFVTGPGPNFSSEFTENRDVAGITFTGSRAVGLSLYNEFLTHQPYVKPVLMELGSKNPAIITAKADLKKAVEGVVRAAYGYSGQKCSANSRVYVQSEVKDEFLEMLRKRLASLEVQDPREKAAFPETASPPKTAVELVVRLTVGPGTHGAWGPGEAMQVEVMVVETFVVVASAEFGWLCPRVDAAWIAAPDWGRNETTPTSKSARASPPTAPAKKPPLLILSS
jgi:hypothetical protein